MLNLSRSQRKWKGGTNSSHGGFSTEKKGRCYFLESKSKKVKLNIILLNLLIPKIIANSLTFQITYEELRI